MVLRESSPGDDFVEKLQLNYKNVSWPFESHATYVIGCNLVKAEGSFGQLGLKGFKPGQQGIVADLRLRNMATECSVITLLEVGGFSFQWMTPLPIFTVTLTAHACQGLIRVHDLKINSAFCKLWHIGELSHIKICKGLRLHQLQKTMTIQHPFSR